MIEPEIYAAGVRALNKILELDHQLEPISGLHYSLDPRFIGTIPPELRPKTKTQPLSV